MTIIQQTRVKLIAGDNLITFDWPEDADTVTITGTYHPVEPTVYSIEEAHELFYWLLDHGAY